VQNYVYYDLLTQQVFPARAERNPRCLLCADHPDSLLGQGLYGLQGYLQRTGKIKRKGKPIPTPRGG
jgi:hypothetical protein